jgi:hypothetical protein
VQEAVHDLTKETSERILRRNSTKRDIATQMLEQIFNSQYHLGIITDMVAAKLAENPGNFAPNLGTERDYSNTSGGYPTNMPLV